MHFTLPPRPFSLRQVLGSFTCRPFSCGWSTNGGYLGFVVVPSSHPSEAFIHFSGWVPMLIYWVAPVMIVFFSVDCWLFECAFGMPPCWWSLLRLRLLRGVEFLIVLLTWWFPHPIFPVHWVLFLLSAHACRDPRWGFFPTIGDWFFHGPKSVV